MRRCIYADESGNFDFRIASGASKYFILTTVVMDDDSKVASALLDLRRELAWKNDHTLIMGFHASEDKPFVRDAVFSTLQAHNFRVDATILEKRKAQPRLRPTPTRFYKYAWLYHMRFIANKVATRQDEVLVVAASVGTKQKTAAFGDAIKDVMNQVAPTGGAKSVTWSARSDYCLQIADYCSWAIQRKWERGDDRAYQQIQNKVASEYDLFKPGSRFYY